MKVLFVTLVVLGVGLGPGMYMARRRRLAEGGGRLWLGQVVVVVVSVAWVAAILLIMKEVL
jgi:hypothetical protein